MPIGTAYKNSMLDNGIPTTVYAALHRGDVATGANEITASGRKTVTLGTAANGQRALTGTPPYATWDVAQGETVASIAYWDNMLAGQGSIVWYDNVTDQLFDVSSGKAELNGGTISVTDIT